MVDQVMQVDALPFGSSNSVGARDVCTDTMITFPSGCAYRRRLQAWFAAGGIRPEKVLKLSSYHSIVACVASGTGIAFVPRSVLETIRVVKNVAVYPLRQMWVKLRPHWSGAGERPPWR